MDELLRCQTCGHGVLGHDGDRCRVAGCACANARRDVVDAEIELAARETQALWRSRAATGR